MNDILAKIKDAVIIILDGVIGGNKDARAIRVMNADGSNVGASGEVKISSNDTTSAYLKTKLVGTANRIVATETDDAGNETLVLNAGSTIIDTTTAGQVAGLGAITPVGADVVLTEDVGSANAKGKVTWSAGALAGLNAIASLAAGDILFFDGTSFVRLAKDVNKFLRSDAAAVSWQTVTTAKPDHPINYPAGSFINIGDGGELDVDTGANGKILRNLFTVNDSVQLPSFICPADLNLSGTVTFTAYGYATTAAADKFVKLQYSHHGDTTGDTWDVAYTTEDSGDVAITNTQDDLDKVEWTETVANLGWAANDFIRHVLGRIAPAGADLAGDFGIVAFSIKLPRA